MVLGELGNLGAEVLGSNLTSVSDQQCGVT